MLKTPAVLEFAFFGKWFGNYIERAFSLLPNSFKRGYPITILPFPKTYVNMN